MAWVKVKAANLLDTTDAEIAAVVNPFCQTSGNQCGHRGSGRGGKKSEKLTLANLRAALGWSRNQLAYVMNASDRAIVNWEQGDPISPVYAAKLREIPGVCNELKQLMKPEEIGPWLLTEMEEFEGRTPADLISKGETGRLWASLFYLRSGMPD